MTPALLVNSLSKHFVFPAKKLRKIRVFVSRMLRLFNVYFSTAPAKRLRKNTGAQNTHAPLFFFLSSCDIFFLQSNKSYFVLSGLLFICSINKLNKIDFFVILFSSKAIQHTTYIHSTCLFNSKYFNWLIEFLSLT